MPNITLPDGNKLSFDKKVTGLDIIFQKKLANLFQNKHWS